MKRIIQNSLFSQDIGLDERFFNGLMGKYKYKYAWFVSYRDVARGTDMRTFLSAILPCIPASIKLPVLGFQLDKLSWALVANFNSFPLDYVARQNVGGSSMSFYILKQLPILPPFIYSQDCQWSHPQSLHHWLLPRVLELTYTAYDLKGFAEGLRLRRRAIPLGRRAPLAAALRIRMQPRSAASSCAANSTPPTSTSTASAATMSTTFWKPSPSSNARTSRRRRIPHQARHPRHLRRDAAGHGAGLPYHTRLDPPPAHGWIPPENPLEVVTEQTMG